MPITDDKLYNLLKENEYLPIEQLGIARETAKQEKISLQDALVEKDMISDENIGGVIADFLKLPYVVLSRTIVTDEALRIIPEDFARKQKMITFSKQEDTVKVATSHPENARALQFIAKKIHGKVRVYYATEKDISEIIRRYKKELQSKFDDLLKEQIQTAKNAKVQDAPVAKIVDLLIEYAYDNKASDIHIEPRRGDSLTRFRIDGIMHNVLIVSKALHEQIATRIKVLAKLRTDEHMSAQDGKMQVKLAEEELDIRVSIVPIVEGENIVLRLLSSRSRQFSLSDLGMSDKDLGKVKSTYQKPYGMILVTGPTGSGKTTSIYAVLKILNTKEKNIATIEDPVEYEIEGINQIQVNPKTNLTFADGLRSILRQDPDIIFVGEIRDAETASIAINSALTGHLVLSTLHTNNAPTAIPRLLDMNIEPFLVSSTVNIIIAQRLVRKICDNCRVSYTQPRGDLVKSLSEELTAKHFGKDPEIRMYKGKGCLVCHNTGYIGRVGIFEVLLVSRAIQELINKKADAEDIKDCAVGEGMSTMTEDGLDKVQEGITTIEEVLRVTKE